MLLATAAAIVEGPMAQPWAAKKFLICLSLALTGATVSETTIASAARVCTVPVMLLVIRPFCPPASASRSRRLRAPSLAQREDAGQGTNPGERHGVVVVRIYRLSTSG
ncbi:hypothetical protein D9M69_646370 [compost metagenome]